MEVETEGGVEGSETEEGEVLHIVLNEQLEEDPVEGVWSQVLADLVVEEQVEDPVEEEDDEEGGWEEEGEVVHGAFDEQVVLPFFGDVSRVGESVILNNSCYLI